MLLANRVNYRIKVARKTFDQLSDSQRSYHYRQICRNGVQANFRKLAVFEGPDVPVGYLRLLEGIFVIMLGRLGCRSRYNPAASDDMAKEVRKTLLLPPVSWIGMNAASPLYQGFSLGNGPSECASPNCQEMTYPVELRPAGHRPRHFYEHGSPLARLFVTPATRFEETEMAGCPTRRNSRWVNGVGWAKMPTAIAVANRIHRHA